MTITILKDANGDDLSTGIIAIHAALVPSKDGPAIVYFGTNDQARIYRLNNLQQAPVQLGSQPGWWAFCAGHGFLQDGRWVIAGGVVNQNVDHHGHGEHDSGERRCEIYLPLEEKFEPIADLNFQPDADYGGGRWYPTALTLGNGQVFCAAGHPFSGKKVPNPDWDENQPENDPTPEFIDDTTGHDDYVFGSDGGPRHNNNTPERYLTNQNQWLQLVNESTSHDNELIDEYPRLHLAPSGHVFFATHAKSKKRFYDALTGSYDNTEVEPGDAEYHAGSETTSVILPILPQDLGQIWVLNCGSANNQKINIAEPNPAWESAGPSPLGKAREHACAVILPTGSVFLNAGEVEGGPETPPSELYHPPVNWNNLQYQNNQTGTWEQIESPLVKRGYHGVALLMTDGQVWVAGSTWSDWEQIGVEMEVYTPPYIQPDRVAISGVPASVGYGGVININLSKNVTISRAVLIRCGSMTHAFDSDQRYVVCQFQQSGTKVQVRAPQAVGIAPPGNYMLFVLDDQIVDGHGRPCVEAAILRLCDQTCTPVPNMSTYSKLTIDALKDNSGQAMISEAIWLFLDNFRPHEASYPDQPSVTVRWDSPNGGVIGNNLFRLEWLNPWAENNALPADSAQRFTLRYNVRIHDSIYSNVNVTRNIVVVWQFEHFECHTFLQLTTKPNPFMVDVKGGNPHWLSTDLRVFSVREGESAPVGAPNYSSGEAPLDYLQKALANYNDLQNAVDNPFDDLDEGQDTSALELRRTVGNKAVYNYAIARVRYIAQGQNANDVRVFFRMFNTVGTALEYDTSTTYRRNQDGPGASPLLGHDGHMLISVPFFEGKRDTPGKDMNQQAADESRDLVAQGATEYTRYFGAWLDINQENDKHFPQLYWDDGPFTNILPPFAPVSVKEVVRGYHQCLVAEIHTTEDSIPDVNSAQAGTPANNDNLSQRNLAWVPVGNPGSVATRVAQTTFLARPSGNIPNDAFIPKATVPRGQVLGLTSSSVTTGRRRLMPDELVFDGSQVPTGTTITIYWPDVDLDQVFALAERRASAVVLRRVDEHTLSFTLNGTAYLPLPGGRTAPIPGLMSAELPEGIKAGEQYSVVVHQFSGKKRRIIGTFQLQIPVAHEPDLLDSESTKLSILRWIGAGIPAADPWKPVFERYLGEIGDRVRGFGGEPDQVEPSPNGDGYPGAEIEGGDDEQYRRVTGKVSSLCYDCFGDFEGFLLDHCDAKISFQCTEPALRKLIKKACRERLRLTVKYLHGESNRPVKIWVHCI